MQFRATQWAKVEWSRAVISAHVRLTSISPLQFSQAVARYCESHLADRAVQCLLHRMRRQRSRFIGVVLGKGDGCKCETTACLPSCAPGARTLLSSVS